MCLYGQAGVSETACKSDVSRGLSNVCPCELVVVGEGMGEPHADDDIEVSGRHAATGPDAFEVISLQD